MCRYLYFLWKSERVDRASSVCRSHVQKLQGTHAHLSNKPVLTSDWCWGSVLLPYRTLSWSVRISTMMTAISHTAPSAAEDEKCSCVGTTTAAGECVCVCVCVGLVAIWERSVRCKGRFTLSTMQKRWWTFTPSAKRLIAFCWFTPVR